MMPIACAVAPGGVAWPGTARVQALAHTDRANTALALLLYHPGGLLWATGQNNKSPPHGGIEQQPTCYCTVLQHATVGILYSIAFICCHLLVWQGFGGLLCSASCNSMRVAVHVWWLLAELPCIQLFHGSQVVSVGAQPPERGFHSASSRSRRQIARLLMPF